MAAGSRDDRPSHVPPLYRKRSFVRHLDAAGVSWRWYSFDPGTLRLADVRYRLGHRQQFGYFSKTGLPRRIVLDLTVNKGIPSFLEDAAAGTLPSVSWIDPAFTNFNPLGFPVNDDHPPADVADGQELVLAVYDALASSPVWHSSLLVVVYDEHGGFYDHVPPPDAADDPVTFGRHGCPGAGHRRLAVGGAPQRVALGLRPHDPLQDDLPAVLSGGLARSPSPTEDQPRTNGLRTPGSHGPRSG